MRTVIVFNHPYEGSYCNALLAATIRGLKAGGGEVDLIHLDQDRFNPVMTAGDLNAFREGQPIDPQVIAYRDRIALADHLILLFPIWWELMPAMTKGFIDKVIFPGVAYDYDRSSRWPRMVKRFHRLQRITLMTTMNTHGFFYRLIFGNAIRKALFTGTFWKMGYKNRKWMNFDMVKFVSPEKRDRWLARTEQYFAKL